MKKYSREKCLVYIFAKHVSIGHRNFKLEGLWRIFQAILYFTDEIENQRGEVNNLRPHHQLGRESSLKYLV